MADATIEAFIKSATRTMDQLANQKLVAEALGSGEEAPSKYYDGNAKGNIRIDNCWEIEKVELGDQYGENFVETTTYQRYPAEDPCNMLFLKGGLFPFGNQNVKVTGLFGLFDTLPEDIEFACTVITAGMILNKNAGGVVTSEKIGNYAVSFDTTDKARDFNQALDIINGYRKMDF
jgi:hypothetical protein